MKKFTMNRTWWKGVSFTMCSILIANLLVHHFYIQDMLIINNLNSSSKENHEGYHNQNKHPFDMKNNSLDKVTITSVDQKIPHIAFKVWDKPFPCFAERGVKKTWAGKNLRGLYYIKVPKTASSTILGINFRIARKHVTPSLSKQNITKCGCSHSHTPASRIRIQNRLKDKTFVWTFMREPTSQFLSSFFHFEVSRKGIIPNITNFKKYEKVMFKSPTEIPQMDYINPIEIESKDIENEEKIIKIIQDILDVYDFIGLTERLDESLVVLRFILGLNAEDILYVPAKASGGYDDGRYNNTCIKIQKSVIKDEEMKEYISSSEWTNKIKFSMLLHEAVNKSLDDTIENIIGREKFSSALNEHKDLMSLVNKKCASSAIFPCSKEGKLQYVKARRNCYFSDSGCGYPCIDELYYNISNNITF